MAEVLDAPYDDQPKKLGKRDADKVLKEARERFEVAFDVDRENREAAVEDTKFVYVAGAQTPEDVKKLLKDTAQPAFEYPQLKQFVNQVINDQRQNRPGIRVHPAGTKATEDLAELHQGIIRAIEYRSQAEAAYDTGYQHSVVGGRGYWRVATGYVASDSFDQELKIQRIADPSTVFLDPDYQEPDGSDRNYAFVTESVKEEDFKQRWPKAKPLSWSPGNSAVHWYPKKEEVIVADYYRRVCKDDTLILLTDGTTRYLSQMPAGVALPPGVTIATDADGEQHSRPTSRYTVEWYKIAGGEQVLESHEWRGTMIPIIACVGDEIIVEGKRHFYGLIRQARDAQRAFNIKKNAELGRYLLGPRAPYMAAVESITGHEEVWKTANKYPYSVLPYHPFDEAGRPLPPPQRIAPAPIEGAWAQSAQMDKGDMRSVIGMYENSLGLHGQETSGRAILAREKQGDNSTFHFADNLSRAIALTGRILLELIPYYYDTHRVVTLVGIDDTRKQTMVNEPVLQEDGTMAKNNDLTVGEFTVTVEAGPSYATKRQETAEKLTQLVQSYPPMMTMAGDVVVGSLDLPDAEELAERLKIMLPAPIQQALQAKEQGEDPAAAQAMAQVEQIKQQATQAMQSMQDQLKQVQAQLQDKSTAAQLAANARVMEAKIGAVADIEIAEIQGRVKAQIQAMTQPAEPAQPAAPAEDPQAPILQALSALMQQFDSFTQAYNAPSQMQFEMDPSGNPIAVNDGRRRTELQFDPQGNPIGATRQSIQQGAQ